MPRKDNKLSKKEIREIETKYAHVVNIFADGELTDHICVSGDLNIVTEKLRNWHTKAKPLRCYSTFSIMNNTCYLGGPTILDSDNGYSDQIVIHPMPLEIVSFICYMSDTNLITSN